MANPLKFMRIREMQGGRYNPLSNTFGPAVRRYEDGRPKPHQGWDLAAPLGTPIYAIADGSVTSRRASDYGLSVTLEFQQDNRTYYAFYAHLSQVVCANCCVKEGALLGHTGASGAGAGEIAKKWPGEVHLHFEIRTVPAPGRGTAGRIDPGQILGFSYLACHSTRA